MMGENSVFPCYHVPGLLLRQLHRLREEAQNALGHSPGDVEKDMRQSLVTVFNSRPDMYAASALWQKCTTQADMPLQHL